MKIISISLATAAFLAAAVSAAGFALNAVELLSIGCAACIVGLFVHDYGRARRGRSRARVRRSENLRSPVAPTRISAGSESRRVDPTSTASGSLSRTLLMIHVPGRPGGMPKPAAARTRRPWVRATDNPATTLSAQPQNP